MEKISINSLKVWDIKSYIYISIFIILSLSIYFGLNLFPGFSDTLILALSSIPLLFAFYQLIRLIKLSKILYNSWGFLITEDMVVIKKGIIFEKITHIPMNRVQHINTIQGPIMKKYNLREISINTAGGSHNIVCLQNERALELQKIIGNYAERSNLENEI